MSYLLVDEGNTRLKAAFYAEGEPLHSQSFERGDSDSFREFLCRGEGVGAAILSGTADFGFDIELILREAGVRRIEHFSHTTPLPLRNLYKSPETLGHDRLLTALAASEKFPKKDIIIFDLGTAITIDSVSKEGDYLGGVISPGMEMRFAALHHFTARLPHLMREEIAQMQQNYDESRVPNSTREAIFYGVVDGLRHEIEGYLKQNDQKVVYFTGGDALFFEKLIKMPIFVDSQSTLRGLGIIITKLCTENY